MNVSYNTKFIILFFSLPLLMLLFYMVFNISLQDNYHHINIFYFLIVFFISLGTCTYLAFRCYPEYPLKDRMLFLFLTLTVLLSPFGDYVLIPVIGALIFVLVNPISRQNIFTKFDKLDIFWLIFVSYCLINSLFIPTFDKGSAIGISFAFLAYGILFKVARYTIIPNIVKKDLFMLFSAVLIITINFGIYHLLHTHNIFLPAPLNISLFSSAYGLASIFSNWPANTAGFLTMSFFIIFYQLFFLQNYFFQKLYLSFTLFIIFIGILATETRMALLFLFGFLGIFTLLYPFQKFKKLRFIVLILPILVLPILVQYSTKWQETLSNPFKQATIVDRLHQYQYGLSVWKDNNYFFGIGLMNFRYSYDLYGDPLIKKLLPGRGRIEFLHNIYLSFLTETGLIGLILLLSCIILLFKVFWSYLPRSPAYFGIYFLFGLISVGLVDSWFFVLRFSVYLFIVLGFTLGSCEKDPNKIL